jgi:uncharacterized protein YcgL (UPF0745 family)
MKIADHYSFVAEHPKTYEIHDARDNKTFHVSKKGLSLSTQKKMAGIKKYADGGEVEEDQQAGDPFASLNFLTPTPTMTPSAPMTPTMAPVPTPAPMPQMNGEMSEAVSQGLMPENQGSGASATWQPSTGASGSWQEESAPQQGGELQFLGDGEDKTQGQQQATPQTQGTMDPVAMQLRAADTAFKAEAEKSKALEAQYANQENMLKKMDTDFKALMKTRNDRSDQLFNEVQNNKIDPKRYMANMSTGSRIASAIGVILGGLAQGLMGSDRNPGLDALNKAIDRDIEAQKLAGENANNVYNQYLKQTNNEFAAHQMAKQDLMTIAAAQASKIAAQMGTPQAAAQRDMLKAQISGQMQQATKAMMGNQVAQLATTQGIPVQALTMVPEEQRKRMIKLPNGLWADAGNPEKAQRFGQFEERHNSIAAELNNLKNLVQEKGTYEVFGPHNEKLLSSIEAIATDSAKLFDPTSVARESEVAQFKRMLFEPNKASMTNNTALEILNNYERMLNRRAQEQWQSIPAYQNAMMQRKSSDSSVAQFEKKRK